MCNQAVGLIQGAVEASGIASVSISQLEDVARKVKSPRALFVPYRLGYPLGKPNDPALHRKIILQALKLLERSDLPILESFQPEAN